MNKQQQIEFKVIDNNTGKEADIGEIALKEDWAKGLMYCDMEGFAILDDGNLVLLDECGKYEYCPSERFSVKFEDSVVLSREEYENLKAENDKYVKDCIDYIATINKLENKVWEVEQQSSKETAEKILERGKYCMPSGLREWIEERYGVEVEE